MTKLVETNAILLNYRIFVFTEFSTYMVKLLVCEASVEEVWLVWQDRRCWSLLEIGKARPTR